MKPKPHPPRVAQTPSANTTASEAPPSLIRSFIVKTRIYRFELSPRGDFLFPAELRRKYPHPARVQFRALAFPGLVILERKIIPRAKILTVPGSPKPLVRRGLRFNSRGHLRLPPEIIQHANLAGPLILNQNTGLGWSIWTTAAWNQILRESRRWFKQATRRSSP